LVPVLLLPAFPFWYLLLLFLPQLLVPEECRVAGEIQPHSRGSQSCFHQECVLDYVRNRLRGVQSIHPAVSSCVLVPLRITPKRYVVLEYIEGSAKSQSVSEASVGSIRECFSYPIKVSAVGRYSMLKFVYVRFREVCLLLSFPLQRTSTYISPIYPVLATKDQCLIFEFRSREQ